MKTAKPAVILLLALVLLTVTANQPVVAMVEPDISNTRAASCLVKVTSDPSVLPGGYIAIEYLMHSSGIAGKAAREILGIPPDIASKLFTIEEIESIFPDSAGGMGIPPDYQPRASTYGTNTTSRSARPTTPTAVRTPARAWPTTTSTPFTTTPTRTPTSPTPTLTQPTPSTTEQTILFRLHVEFPDSLNVLMSNMFGDIPVDKKTVTKRPIKPAAEEFMAVLVENLRSALSGAFEEYHSKLDNRLVLADKEAIRAEKQLVEMQAKLRDISGSRDLSRYAILRDISSLRQKLQTNIMDMTSYKSTIEATTKQIAGERVRRMELIENDPITKEFKSIVDVHEKRLKDTQKLYDAGRASAAELEDVKEKIIRARIELAKRQEEVSKSAGGDLLSSLNQQIANLSIKENETMAQIENLQKQIEESEALLSSADEYELVSLKADIARQNLEETLLWRARLGRNIRSVQPPDVTVIGAE